MAYNTAVGRAEYSATAGQTIFTFSFKIFQTSDVEVYLTPAGSTPDDTTDILIETTDYTVTIDGDNGGTVTLITGATLNDAVTIVRELPNTRSTEYQELGDLYANTLNQDQDYQTYLSADQSVRLDRNISIPKSSQNVSTVLPTPEALKLIRWNVNADAFENIDQSADLTKWVETPTVTAGQTVITLTHQTKNASVYINGALLNPNSDYTTSGNTVTLVQPIDSSDDEVVLVGGDIFLDPPSTQVVYVPTITAMGSVDPLSTTTVIVQEEGRGGTFNYDATQSAVNDGGTIFDGWVRQYNGSVNVKWFGAVGDGVTDDSSYFTAIESLAFNEIDLGGYTYLISKTTLDKKYFNGNIKFSSTHEYKTTNKKLNTPIPDTDSVFATSKSNPSQQSALIKIDDNTINSYKHLGSNKWAKMTLSNGGDVAVPFSWNTTSLEEIDGFILSNDSAITYTGTWNVLGSGSSTTYIGGSVNYCTTNVGTYLDIPIVHLGGPLNVNFMGRTSSCFISVTIDGSTELVDSLTTHATGYKYFDAFTSVDLQYKQKIKISHDLPAGSYTVRLDPQAEKNASSTGNTFYFDALSFNGFPFRDNTDVAKWQATEVIALHEQRKVEGRYYSCTVAGTTSSTAPTHTSGSVVDGTVTWLYMDGGSSFATASHRIQAAGSQLEYAYELKPDGGTVFNDVGGLLHGNEALTSADVVSDGLLSDMVNGVWYVGDIVKLRQNIETSHTEIGGNIISTYLEHSFSNKGITVSHDHTFNVDSEIRYFYNAMWPLLHWDALGYKYGINTLRTATDGSSLLSDYYGQSNPIVGKTQDFKMIGEGVAFTPDGVAGVPSATAGVQNFGVSLTVDSESVGDYFNSDLYAAKATNIAGTTAPGFSSVVSKMYFSLGSTSVTTSYSTSDVIKCRAHYDLWLY